MHSCGINNGAGACSLNVSFTTIFKYVIFVMSNTSTFGFRPVWFRISVCNFCFTLTLLAISDIAHTNVTTVVSTPPVSMSYQHISLVSHVHVRGN
ncbi:hypothetical protein Hanom_Chr07g00662581 [Helianthus anomalus]